MRFSAPSFAIVIGLALAPAAAIAQALQLPTFSMATVSTTVMVPDQGSAFMGGISRASDGRSEFGVPGITLPGFQNRGIGQSRSASNISATATIHDFDAMDQALLNSPGGFSGANPTFRWPDVAPAFVWQSPERRPTTFSASWQIQPDPPAPVTDLAAEQAARATRQAARATEADDFFARGQQAEADGKSNVAKIYYKMALRRASGELQKLVQARLDAVSGRTTALAKNTP